MKRGPIGCNVPKYPIEIQLLKNATPSFGCFTIILSLFPGIYQSHKNRLRNQSRSLWLKYFVLTIENLLTIEVDRAFVSYLRPLMQDLNKLFPGSENAHGNDITIPDLMKVFTMSFQVKAISYTLIMDFWQVGSAVEKLLGLFKNLEASEFSFKKDGRETQMIWDLFQFVSRNRSGK